MIDQVREVTDAWPPHGRLFLVPVEADPADHDGCLAIVEYAPRSDRAGNFLTCRACADVECDHCRAVVAYLNPPQSDPLPMGPVSPALYE